MWAVLVGRRATATYWFWRHKVGVTGEGEREREGQDEVGVETDSVDPGAHILS